MSLWLSVNATAAPVSLSLATNAVGQWLAADPMPLAEHLGHQIKGAVTVNDPAGRSLYHVVHLAPSGFVLLAADDRIQPIVAFGGNGNFEVTAGNAKALGALAKRDISSRLAMAEAHPGAAQFLKARTLWRQFTEGGRFPPIGTTALATNISTIRVAPFLQTLWDQTTLGHDTSVACYNYYTPPYTAGTANNDPCGCVATAMAQVMYYFQYPTAGVGTNAFAVGINGSLAYLDLRGGDGAGGPYLWSNMPPVPQNSTTAQCQAIGALTYDAGLSVNMAYTVDDSETTLLSARDALAGTFLFSNAVLGGKDSPSYSLSSVLVNMINPDLDARLPVMLGIWAGPSEGHCALCDGYGYIGSTLYHHLNLGYSGTDNGWYALPDINTDAELTYTNISSCIYNVYPNGAGEIISGRIVNGFGNPVPGATVAASHIGGGTFTAVSDTNGIFALVKLPSKSQYTLTVSQTGYSNATGQWSTGTSQNSTATTGNIWGANFILTATQAPSIQAPPQSQIALVGGTATFTVTAAGAGTLAYQWSQNGQSLANTNSVLIVSNISAASAGMYVATVSNAFGTAVSTGAVLTVEQAGSAPLAQNGGFETGSFANWQISGNSADTSVAASPLYVHSGAFGAALGPSGSLGFLTQNLATTNGATYVLSFWLDSPDGKTPNEFLVSWNGTNLFDSINMGVTGWTNLQFLVTASVAITPLEFGFRNDNSYFGLDAITVNNATPALASPQLTVQVGNSGEIVMTVTRLTGQGSILVQTSTDLVRWIPIFTNAPTFGAVEFTNGMSNLACSYYRAVVEAK